MPAPSVAVYKDPYTPGAASTTRILAQQTVATGDVVAVVAETAGWSGTGGHASGLAQTAGTAVISTPGLAQEAGSASHCGNALWTFTVTTGGTLTLTVTYSGTMTGSSSTCWTYVATGCNGIGNTNMTTTSSTTITASLTTSANSYVIAHAADWGSTSGATTTLTPGGGVLDAHEQDGVVDGTAVPGSQFASRGGHWADTGGPATVSYGVTLPTSAAYCLVVCEMLAGGTSATVPMGPALAVTTAQAAPQLMSLTSTAYAATAADLGGGAGSWVNAGNADGTPDGSFATWTVPA